MVSYIWTRPRIEAYRASVMKAAIDEVLAGPSRLDTLFFVDGALTAQAPPATRATVERIYRGWKPDATAGGYAVQASEAGFADQIVLMVGFDATSGEVLGIRVLSSKETPGLGDKIERPAFLDQFRGAAVPLRGVKDAAAKGADRAAIVMITGATISSRTMVREINNVIARWTPLIREFEAQPEASR